MTSPVTDRSDTKRQAAARAKQADHPPSAGVEAEADIAAATADRRTRHPGPPEEPSPALKTMEEFSVFVGLSRPTVSKYFNDPSSVRGKTRERIEAALRESGFRPNMFAVNLNRRRSNIVGVIIPNWGDPFYMALTHRVETIARDAGYLAFVLTSDGDPDLEEKAVETLTSMNVAGAVVAPLGLRSRRPALERFGASIPLVYVDLPIDDTAAFVGTDNRRSFQIMVDYLCRSGTPPCFLGMPEVNTNAGTRRLAYVEAMERLGLAPFVVEIEPSLTWDFESFGFDAVSRILREGGFPTSTVLCANDRVAFGALSAAWKAGLKVGHGIDGELRVAGHDDHPLSRFASPSLTTVAQDYNEIGGRAMAILLRKMAAERDEAAGGAPREEAQERILLPSQMVLRDSA